MGGLRKTEEGPAGGRSSSRLIGAGRSSTRWVPLSSPKSIASAVP